MNNIIGFLKNMTNGLFAMDSLGNLRKISYGDAIFKDEYIVNDMGIVVNDSINNINMDNKNTDDNISELNIEMDTATHITKEFTKISSSLLENIIDHSGAELNVEASLREEIFAQVEVESLNRGVIDINIETPLNLGLERQENFATNIFTSRNIVSTTIVEERPPIVKVEIPNKEVVEERPPIVKVEIPNKEVVEGTPPTVKVEIPNKEVVEGTPPTVKIEIPNKEVVEERPPIVKIEIPNKRMVLVPNKEVVEETPSEITADIPDKVILVPNREDDTPLLEDTASETDVIIPITRELVEELIEDSKEFNITLNIEQSVTNLSFIIDVSSSMSDEDLAIAKEALVTLVNRYDNMGDVNVNIVQFFGNDNYQSGWIEPLEANDLVLDTDQGGTDIEQGLRAMVEDTYSGNQPIADQDIIYFFGDGDTYGSYQRDFDEFTGIERNDDGDILEIDYDNDWTNFILSGDIDKLYTYSINTDDVLSDISHIADNGESVISQDAVNLTDISELKDELLSTVEPSGDGSFAIDDEGNSILLVGEDSGHLDSITIAGNRVDYDEDTPIQSVDGTYGTFEVNFDTASYTYTLTDTSSPSSHREVVEPIVLDENENALETISINLDIICEDGVEEETIIEKEDDAIDFDNIDNEEKIESEEDIEDIGYFEDDNITLDDILDTDEMEEEIFIEEDKNDEVTTIEKPTKIKTTESVEHTYSDSSVSVTVDDSSLIAVI